MQSGGGQNKTYENLAQRQDLPSGPAAKGDVELTDK